MKITTEDFIAAFIPVPCVVAFTDTNAEIIRHTMNIVDWSSPLVHGFINTLFAGIGSTCALLVKAGLKKVMERRRIRKMGKRIKPRTIVWYPKEKQADKLKK